MSREATVLGNYESLLSEEIVETYRELLLLPLATSLQQRLAWLFTLKNQLSAVRGKPLDVLPFWLRMEPYTESVWVPEWDGKTR